MASCPNCSAPVPSPERVYQVTVEPSQGERGVTKRDVGMFRCQRCDMSFPRVLSKKHYLLVPEVEFTRLKNEANDLKKKTADLEAEVEAARKEKVQSEEALNQQLRDDRIGGLESEASQLERHVKYLKAERDYLRKEIGES